MHYSAKDLYILCGGGTAQLLKSLVARDKSSSMQAQPGTHSGTEKYPTFSKVPQRLLSQSPEKSRKSLAVCKKLQLDHLVDGQAQRTVNCVPLFETIASWGFGVIFHQHEMNLVGEKL